MVKGDAGTIAYVVDAFFILSMHYFTKQNLPPQTPTPLPMPVRLAKPPLLRRPNPYAPTIPLAMDTSIKRCKRKKSLYLPHTNFFQHRSLCQLASLRLLLLDLFAKHLDHAVRAHSVCE